MRRISRKSSKSARAFKIFGNPRSYQTTKLSNILLYSF